MKRNIVFLIAILIIGTALGYSSFDNSTYMDLIRDPYYYMDKTADFQGRVIQYYVEEGLDCYLIETSDERGDVNEHLVFLAVRPDIYFPRFRAGEMVVIYTALFLDTYTYTTTSDKELTVPGFIADRNTYGTVW